MVVFVLWQNRVIERDYHMAHKTKNIFHQALFKNFADPWLKGLNYSFEVL